MARLFSLVLAASLVACSSIPIYKTVPATIQQVANLSEEQLDGKLHYKGDLDLFDNDDNIPYNGKERFLPIIDPTILSRNTYSISYNGNNLGYSVMKPERCSVNLKNNIPTEWMCQ